MQKTWSKTIVAVSLAEGSKVGRLREPVHHSEDYRLAIGARQASEEAMCDQGCEGTDSGWSSPTGGRLEPLPAAQIGQAATNRRASLAMDDHQKRCLINL